MTSQVIIFGERLRASQYSWDLDDNISTRFLWSSYNPFVKLLLNPALMSVYTHVTNMPRLACFRGPAIGYTSIKMTSTIPGSCWEILPTAIDETDWDQRVRIDGWVRDNHYPRLDYCDMPPIWLNPYPPNDGMVKVHTTIEARFLLGSLVGRLISYRRVVGSRFREYRLIALVH
jgi:hypothetical protein